MNNVFPSSTTAGMSSTCISLISTKRRRGIFFFSAAQTDRAHNTILWRIRSDGIALLQGGRAGALARNVKTDLALVRDQLVKLRDLRPAGDTLQRGAVAKRIPFHTNTLPRSALGRNVISADSGGWPTGAAWQDCLAEGR